MRLDFGDCGVANEALSQVGYNVRGAQLDGGELKGSIQVNQIESMLAMRIHASHRLLFVGEPVPGRCRLLSIVVVPISTVIPQARPTSAGIRRALGTRTATGKGT